MNDIFSLRRHIAYDLAHISFSSGLSSEEHLAICQGEGGLSQVSALLLCLLCTHEDHIHEIPLPSIG